MVKTQNEPQRKIIHIDMDCFYAAIEMRDNPAYRDIPIAIGGDRIRRGVLCTCNYPARVFGVRSAMPTALALRLCPQLVVLPGRMDEYKRVSAQLHSILRRYSNIIEPLSLDEAYLDVTNSELFNGSATLIAQDIRKTIKLELNITASAGVAPNKFLAKIASDENKPDGIFVITPQQTTRFSAALPLRKIPGVGKVSEKRLAQYELFTGADVLPWSEAKLVSTFGKLGAALYWRVRGVDLREVQPSRRRKSIGVELTLLQDIDTIEQCRTVISHLLPKLQRRSKGKVAADIQKLGLKLKFADFNQTSVERRWINGKCEPLPVNEPLPHFTIDSFESLLAVAFERRQGRAIRLVGISIGLAEHRLLSQQGEKQLTAEQLSLAL